MALDRRTERASEFQLRDDDVPLDNAYADDGDRSNMAAMMLGGLVVAGGLLAFLYYDDANFSGRDDLTTGSLGRIEMPAPAGSPNIITSPRPAAQATR